MNRGVGVNAFFENRAQDLFDLAGRVEAAFSAAGVEYRIVGGLATYLYVEETEPDAGRLTKEGPRRSWTADRGHRSWVIRRASRET